VVKTEIELAGDETKIRSSETALGDVIADQMLQAHWQAGDPAAPPCPVPDAAFINSGSLRLNTDIRAGSVVTFGDVDALMRFPTELRLVSIKGSELLGAIEHSVTSWGSGPWLQVSACASRMTRTRSPS
jgi:2',3'-cyclic-nucleotide 2'-phosphodiesterase (5'-nucleotidase family)